jgi:hypothetical protein
VIYCLTSFSSSEKALLGNYLCSRYGSGCIEGTQERRTFGKNFYIQVYTDVCQLFLLTNLYFCQPVQKKKSSIFWDVVPYSRVKVNQRFRRTFHLHFQGRKISQRRNQYEAGTKQRMKAKYSSETSVDFQGNTMRYIPEDRTLYNHRCENLKSYDIKYINNSESISSTPCE